jgi:hypothetical protein
VVMKRTTVIEAIIVMLILADLAQAGVSMVRNGSFEDDGQSIPDIKAESPKYWCDINWPEDISKFGGKVNTDWSTYGDYSLTLSSKAGSTFVDGDMVTISQQAYLMNVNQIIFDIELSGTHGAFPWTSEKFSALLLIDGNDVWDSNGSVPDEDGEYTIEVNDININDANLHTLSLAMRANNDGTHITQYLVRWDFVKFDTHCGGFGYLPEDFDRDCYVNFSDFGMLANHWLEENPAYKYDLFEDGVVDEDDLKVFAEGWLDCSDWQYGNCYEVALLAGDVDDSGQVDLRDISRLTDGWLAPADCDTRADINGDGVVNFGDFAVLAEEWRLKSWLYGL